MTINTEIRVAGPFVGDGAAVNLDFTFKVFEDTDLLVISRDDATGDDTNLVLGADYTVLLSADQDNSPGGRVILTSALAIGSTAYIVSQVSPLQGAVFTNTGGFYPSVLNDALDRLHALHLENRETNSRAVLSPVGEDVSLMLPALVARVGKFLYFDASGNLSAATGTADGPLREELAQDDGPSLVSFSHGETFAIGTLGAHMQGRVDIAEKPFNAKMDGTDDSVAFDDAIDHIKSSDRSATIWVPPGTMGLAPGRLMDGGVPVHLQGHPGRSIIRTLGATGDTIDMQAWNSTIQGIRFDAEPAVTRTAGRTVIMTGAKTEVRFCQFNGDYTALDMVGVEATAVFNRFGNGAPGSRRVLMRGGDTSHNFLFNKWAAQTVNANSPYAGIIITDSSAAIIMGNQIIGQGRNILLAPGVGEQVFSPWIIHNFSDTAGYGQMWNPSGDGLITRAHVVGLWGSSHVHDGFLIQTAGTSLVDDCQFDMLDLRFNGGNGFVADGTTGRGTGGRSIRNLTIGQLIVRGNASSGAAFTKVDGLDIAQLLANPTQAATATNLIGLYLSSVENYTVNAGDVTGQTTNAVSGHTLGDVTKMIRSLRGYATQNEGQATVAFDASGVGTITHGLGATPRYANVMLLGAAVNELEVQALSSTTITVHARNTTTNANFTGSLGVMWEVRR